MRVHAAEDPVAALSLWNPRTACRSTALGWMLEEAGMM